MVTSSSDSHFIKNFFITHEENLIVTLIDVYCVAFECLKRFSKIFLEISPSEALHMSSLEFNSMFRAQSLTLW